MSEQVVFAAVCCVDRATKRPRAFARGLCVAGLSLVLSSVLGDDGRLALAPGSPVEVVVHAHPPDELAEGYVAVGTVDRPAAAVQTIGST